MGTRVAVIGPGAIGATVAAYLHAAGQPVLLCGRSARDGVEVRRDDRDPIVVPGPVHTDPTAVEAAVDVVLLAVKDTQNEQAGQWLARLADEILGMLRQSPPDSTTSMLTDREAHRPLAWDIRNGVIARKAAGYGVATPVSDVLVPLLAAASDGPG